MTPRALRTATAVAALVLLGLVSYVGAGALLEPTVTVVQTAAMPAESAAVPIAAEPDPTAPGALGLALVVWGSVLVVALAVWVSRQPQTPAPVRSSH